jgi:hypothetical protein
MVPASDLFFDFPHLLGKELHRSAALGADHVMMPAPVVLMFVTRDAIVKSYLARQPTPRQQLQGPVNGGESDAWIGFPDQPMQFVDRKMFPGFKESPQNGAALSGLLQADAFKMPQKNPLGLEDVLWRDSRLIVDSFLQHGEQAVDNMIKRENPLRQPAHNHVGPQSMVRGNFSPSAHFVRFIPRGGRSYEAKRSRVVISHTAGCEL